MRDTAGAGARVARRIARTGRYGVPMGLGLVCLAMLGQRVSAPEARAMLGTLGDISALQWLAAAGAVAIGFWALGRYDAIVHRHLGTGIGRREATRSGAAAIALSQTLGFGVLTGALARWRMLPGLSPLDAARVSAAVAVSFLTGWAVVTAAVSLLPGVPGLPPALSVSVLLAAPALAAAAVLWPRLRIMGRTIHLPTLPAMAAILGFTLLDTLAAAAALHILLPETAGIGFATLFTAYLLALGAALLTGTPGGVGPFELTLLALLPALPQADLLASVMAFRLLYYALPAALALIPLARPRAPRRRPPLLSADGVCDPGRAARSELGLCRQTPVRSLAFGGAEAAVATTGQTLTLLFAPIRGPLAPLLAPLARAARAENRAALLYKLAASDALAARRAGWTVLRVADEAVLDPCTFDTAAPAFRQLRRKLRQAAKAGVSCDGAQDIPSADLARIDAAWIAAHGTARGFVMGRFAPTYVARQRILVARKDGVPIAFVTFHEGPEELCLDLVRHLPGCPDGTMHALVAAAIAEAAAEGRRRLSLAALPARGVRETRLAARLRARIAGASGGPGLARFKDSFGIRREPLYAAAPDRPSLALGLCDLALATRRGGRVSPAHQDHAAREIAFGPGT